MKSLCIFIFCLLLSGSLCAQDKVIPASIPPRGVELCIGALSVAVVIVVLEKLDDYWISQRLHRSVSKK
jgi:hypothetical protein